MRIGVSTRDGYGLERIASSWLTAPLTEALLPTYKGVATYYPLLYTTRLAGALDRGPRVILHHHLGACQVGGSVRRTLGWV